MADRILESYLDAGLLELNGQDAWFSHITKAADTLAIHIAAHPEDLASFLYSVIDPSDRQADPAHIKALEFLKEVWRTFSSVSMGSVDLVLKGIILDAIIQNAARDPQVKLSIALILSSAMPHIELGAEASVWQPLLNQLIQDVDKEAETQWSLPGALDLPKFPNIKTQSLGGRIGGIKFDETELRAGIEEASGPQNTAGQATNGNQYWPNQGEAWAKQFAPALAETVSTAIQRVSVARPFSLKAEELAAEISTSVENYMNTVAQQLAVSAQGVDLRSRLLWWKEAKVSPSARRDYRELPAPVASVLMAFDYQSMLPALAPASVEAFLRETVKGVLTEDKEMPISEYLAPFATSDLLKPYKTGSDIAGEALRPLCSLAMAGITKAEDIGRYTVYDSGYMLAGPEAANLFFIELQALKTLELIESVELQPEQEDDQAQGTTKNDKSDAENAS